MRVVAVNLVLLLGGLVLGSGIASVLLQSRINALETQVSLLQSGLQNATASRVPALVPVTLDSKTTALLLLDFTTSSCYRRASCNATLPTVQTLLAKARAASVQILYTRLTGPIVQPLLNRTGETVITNDQAADKFYSTDLENWLRGKSIKTVVIAGVAANGAVLYTAFEATLRGFTVVVPADGIASDSNYIQNYTLFQLLNQPGRANAQNKPLAPSAITLSSASLISFVP